MAQDWKAIAETSKFDSGAVTVRTFNLAKKAWLFIVRTASYFGCHISAHSRPPEKPIQMSQCFGNTKMIHLTQLSFLPLCHRDIPVEDHSGTLPGSCLYDRKPSLASGAGGCFPVGPDHIQVQAGTTLICGWLPASLGIYPIERVPCCLRNFPGPEMESLWN
ncbi:Retina-specific copper amine oxidase [Frankliniella fusca]|uniref:Retina-specific copper amine oxidase n=1 Tax=Frankliniella fusca TaxID=407009 RepID=A0AAE1LGY1_9NEOP|nr:Retina-specific copper amine oxidase [Frankliniella fusca]KAK3918319.1 Retina-specific copper amine oxidase [Frankliniella fusca]